MTEAMNRMRIDVTHETQTYTLSGSPRGDGEYSSLKEAMDASGSQGGCGWHEASSCDWGVCVWLREEEASL